MPTPGEYFTKKPSFILGCKGTEGRVLSNQLLISHLMNFIVHKAACDYKMIYALRYYGLVHLRAGELGH